ncbi:inositol monophosphatase family protein [Nocardioides houyundeii]|uniref:inositol monophosphatase family protein n=1 Tax=Nocardioides houyundeii TaxID=2045452 RepID=UPI00241102C0|nr:inositol monophosphatase family protein [Nocardioides houyundeii]
MTTETPNQIPPAAISDDHAFAVWAAEQAGERLLQVRAEGLEGRALKDAGDAAAQSLLAALLAEHRPDDAVLSEEAADDKSRLDAPRVWIIDPLDGTREFSEPPRDDWAVHVALWESGELTAGAVAQPALGRPSTPAVPRWCRPGPRCVPASRSPGPVRRRSSRRWPPSSTPSWCRWAPRGSR